MTKKSDETDIVPGTQGEPRLISTYEGASAFPIDDPFVRLVFTYGSFLPGADTLYGSPEEMMLRFIDAVQQAGQAHPELALQYAAWLRDPRQGKGNRSQPPWVLAVLASLPECVAHPRFAELVARCIVRPDDSIYLIQAAAIWLGDNQFPQPLKIGIARGLEGLSDYQLAKYASSQLNLMPRKKGATRKALPEQTTSERSATLALPSTEVAERANVSESGERTLRLVDVLGICKQHLSSRLFLLYRYLHAPTRERAHLLPLLDSHFPLFHAQKVLRMNPPREVNQVQGWVSQALQARMTMEQMFSATGMAPGQRQQLLAQTSPSQSSNQEERNSLEDKLRQAFPQMKTSQQQQTATSLANLRENEVKQLHIRAELWKTLLGARVPSENDPEKTIPFLGDMAFLRNVRGMYQAGILTETLVAEAARRQFGGLWPFQLLSAAREIEHGKRRGNYQSSASPGVLPVLDTIFEQIALAPLPRKNDGTLYRILGLADVSGSMTVRLGGKNSSATCMDAALSFSVAFSYTIQNNQIGGLAGTWDNTFHPVLASSGDRPLARVKQVAKSGGIGGGGTQVFGSLIALINWLVEHPQVPHPEVLVVLSDMQFHPPAHITPDQLRILPRKYQHLIQRPAFSQMPPLAAAMVLYREVLGNDVNLILWNLASYEGSPVPSNMERVLMLSGFDANSFHTIEQWLRAGSPRTALPMAPEAVSADSGQSNSSFEAVLAVLRRY